MSASGIMDSVKMSGMLRFVPSSFDDVLPRMYPRARCPTAKRGLFLLCGWERFPLLRVIVVAVRRVAARFWLLAKCMPMNLW